MFWSTTIAAIVFGLAFVVSLLPELVRAEEAGNWTAEASAASSYFGPPLLGLLVGGATYLVLYRRDRAD
jgi:hypothetical protein